MTMLQLKENGAYTLCLPSANQVTTNCQPTDNQLTVTLATQSRLGKDSLGQDRIGEDSCCFPPSREEVEAFVKAECLGKVNLDKFFDYYNANGWMVGKNPMKDWKAVLRNWNRNEKDKGVHKFAPEGRDLAYLEK